jgi:squalene-hopene/tetraprenyl-beta-curcumene cyclase
MVVGRALLLQAPDKCTLKSWHRLQSGGTMTQIHPDLSHQTLSLVKPAYVDQAVEAGAAYLLAEQRSDGAWFDYLSSSAIATGAALFALYLSDPIRFARELQEGVRWLRETQQPDGSWGDATVDSDALNGSSIAVAALQLLDAEQSEDAIKRGWAYLESRGGLDVIGDMAQCSFSVLCLTLLAIVGLCEWQRVPTLPLSIILLPSGLRKKVSFLLPSILSWGLWHAQIRPGGPFRRLVNRICAPKALRWIASVQAEDGGMEESPTMLAVVVINLLKAGVGQEITSKGIGYLLSTRRADGSWAPCRSVDFSATNTVVFGLECAGYLRDPRLEAAKEWMLNSQCQDPFPATGCPAGGWGWGVPSGWPNTDDTANALTVLRHMGVAAEDERLREGLHWLCTMQSRDGSWACFIRNPIVTLMDGPCPGFTAHAVVALHNCGYTPEHPVIQRALRFLKRVQRADGSIRCVWYRNYVSGTAFVLEVYSILGLATDPVANKCRSWLLANQNEDGSWGGIFDETWRGPIGPAGTVEETSWALIGLLKSGYPITEQAILLGISWLVKAQKPDGSWPQSIIGVYFGSVYYSDDLLADGWALQALGLYQQQQARSNRLSI